MDEIVRALQRRYRQGGDLVTAQEYIAQLERSYGLAPDDHRPIDQILMNILLSHYDDEGVNSFTVNATQALVRLVLGEEAVAIYQKYLDGGEERSWISYPQLDQMLLEMNFTCDHSSTCEGNDSSCRVASCVCPGCLQLSIQGNTMNLCFHHSELIIVHTLHHMQMDGLRLRQPKQEEFNW